jgi:predicted RNA methylase
MLTKPQWRKHEAALKLLEQDERTSEDTEFILEHYHPGAGNNVKSVGAFFTPRQLARDLAHLILSPRGRATTYLDLGAGIGMLTHAVKMFWAQDKDAHNMNFICVEVNEDYCTIGKKIAPYATWINADMFDEGLWQEVGTVDFILSNPPFGRTLKGASTKWLNYQGYSDFMAAEIAYRHSHKGAAFIMPQTNLPFRMSGVRCLEELEPHRYHTELQKFQKANPHVSLEPTSFDTAYAQTLWKGVKPTVELVRLEYAEQGKSAIKPKVFEFIPDTSPRKTAQEQSSLFLLDEAA